MTKCAMHWIFLLFQYYNFWNVVLYNFLSIHFRIYFFNFHVITSLICSNFQNIWIQQLFCFTFVKIKFFFTNWAMVFFILSTFFLWNFLIFEHINLYIIYVKIDHMWHAPKLVDRLKCESEMKTTKK